MGELGALIAMQGVSTAASAANTYSQNQAARGQQGFANAMTDVNTGWSNLQQAQLLARGDIAGSRARLGYQQLAGSQRAAYAGSGVDVRSGSAGAIQSESRALGEIERLEIQRQAFNQALGLKAENAAAVSQNRMRQIAVRNGINQSYGRMGTEIGGALLRTGYAIDRYGGLGGNQNGAFDSLISGPDLMTPPTPYDETINLRRTENA